MKVSPQAVLVVALLAAWAVFCAGAPDPFTQVYFFGIGVIVVDGTYVAWRAERRATSTRLAG